MRAICALIYEQKRPIFVLWLLPRWNRATNQKHLLPGRRYWLVRVASELLRLCMATQLSLGLLFGRSGCRDGQRGDARRIALSW